MKKLEPSKEFPHKTIEKPLQIINSRYALAHAVMKRVRAIHNGAPIGPNVDKRLTHEFRHSSMPTGRAIKVVMEEISVGDVKFKHTAKEPEKVETLESTVVFTGEI